MTRTCLTTTSTTRPGCATSTWRTGPPQPPCTDRPLQPEPAPPQANRVNRPPGESTPRGKAADRGNAEPTCRLLVRFDDQPAGRRHRQDDRLRICTAPAGGRFFRPTRPPLLTTRPGGPRTTGAEPWTSGRRPINRVASGHQPTLPRRDLTHHCFSTTTLLGPGVHQTCDAL